MDDGPFELVVASPFLRCVETALELCRVLSCPLLLDHGWGEVHGPTVYEDEPPTTHRPLAEILDVCARAGVEVLNTEELLGAPPAWPEMPRKADNLPVIYK